MEKQKSTLVNASAFFFGLVVVDVYQLVRALLNGSFQFNASVSGLSESAAQTAVTATLIILLVIGSIGTILKLFLAIKGIRQATGKGGKGKSHITLAKVMAVLLVLSLIGVAMGIKDGTQYWTALLSPAISLIASYFYIKSATALKA